MPARQVLVRAREVQPDLFVLDQTLPDLDGVEVRADLLGDALRYTSDG